MPGFDRHLKIHVTGCPNSCGRHWIADLGIEGKKTKVEGTMVDAYYFCVGGGVGLHERIARPVGYRAPATAVPDAIERLLRASSPSDETATASASSRPRTPTRSYAGSWPERRRRRSSGTSRRGARRTAWTADAARPVCIPTSFRRATGP